MKNILFATNLSENSTFAFARAASMATRYQATLILLHVMEKTPTYISKRIHRSLREKQWGKLEELENVQVNEARDTLIGKARSPSKLLREALEEFCASDGIDGDNCNYQSIEIVVPDGDIDQEIIHHAERYKVDLIVLGTREGFLHDNRIGPILKSVLRKTHVPVLVVPPKKKES